MLIIFTPPHAVQTNCTRLDSSHQQMSEKRFINALDSHCVRAPSSASTSWWWRREPGSGIGRPGGRARCPCSHRAQCWALWAGNKKKKLPLVAIARSLSPLTNPHSANHNAAPNVLSHTLEQDGLKSFTYSEHKYGKCSLTSEVLHLKFNLKLQRAYKDKHTSVVEFAEMLKLTFMLTSYSV